MIQPSLGGGQYFKYNIYKLHSLFKYTETSLLQARLLCFPPWQDNSLGKEEPKERLFLYHSLHYSPAAIVPTQLTI